MAQYHQLPEDLAAGYHSRAHWAIDAPPAAIVFVHGFCGHATDTWMDFPTILLGDERSAGADLIFYGYDARQTQAANSAESLLDFLDALATQPWTLTAGSGRSHNDPPYKRIVLACHSLGAVITRRALLNAAADGAEWLDRIRFVLFAPAHHGAHLAVLVSGFLSEQNWFLGKLASKALQYEVPLISDLQPGSVILSGLIDDTRKALASDPDNAPRLVPRAVVWARDERVVINERFPGDPRPRQFAGSHTDICKPSLGFIEPRDIVLGALTEAQ